MIAIVDYGMGNLRSVQKAFESIGEDARVIAEAGSLDEAEAVVLPGVGAFSQARERLGATGLDKKIISLAGSGKPILGICLGMQLLYDCSYEDGKFEGLHILKGEVTHFPKTDLKVPHMGWNTLSDIRGQLFDGLLSPCVYFVHSYRISGVSEDTAAVCDYVSPFTAAAQRGNVFATQFHPEKSGDIGIKILANFVRAARGGNA
ncbi:MAG: imidazole glycerol phosphate synthase subunit HisH [Eubacteriales bacterium]|nr:imidazole glycerol phosphate synthase subunit HisH [Eubacteriales bacterium]MDD3882530.1 imidazole glycerol phosphate synthase subunit HisH [Eubacteriales bacterium]MDD4512830.1 imidazole glycerol phosphate synthase subunit HisH [Eubacteriales bacterium]